MKTSTKKLSVLVMAAFLAVSCGSDKNSSGDSSTSPVSSNDYTNGVINSSGQVFNTIEEVRASFDGISFAAGTAVDTEIIHAGSKYASGGYNNGTLDLGLFELNYNLNFNMGGSATDSMRVLKVTSSSDSSVTAVKATDAQYNPYTGQVEYNYTSGQTVTLSRSSSDYQNMLLTGNTSCAYVEVKGVTITAQTVIAQQYYQQYQQNQQLSISGNQITCWSYYGSAISSYVVSNALPMAANPIVSYENGQSGYLVNVGNTYFTGYQVQY